MRISNLTVEGKIILVIIPFIISIILVLSLLDGYAIRRLYSTSMATYLNHLLEMYIHEYPRHLQELLENNGLDEAKSFVQAYKQRALKRMEEMNKSAKGSLLVYDVTNNSFLNRIEEEDTHTYESVLMKTTEEVYFSKALNDFYMIESFSPWNWKIIAIASDEELHAELDNLRTRNIILSIVIGMIFIVLMRYAIRRLIIKPLKTLENAAEAVLIGDKYFHYRDTDEGRNWNVSAYIRTDVLYDLAAARRIEGVE